jgi:hypothetical protein
MIITRGVQARTPYLGLLPTPIPVRLHRPPRTLKALGGRGTAFIQAFGGRALVKHSVVFFESSLCIVTRM